MTKPQTPPMVCWPPNAAIHRFAATVAPHCDYENGRPRSPEHALGDFNRSPQVAVTFNGTGAFSGPGDSTTALRQRCGGNHC